MTVVMEVFFLPLALAYAAYRLLGGTAQYGFD
jgi:hypothetical protein